MKRAHAAFLMAVAGAGLLLIAVSVMTGRGLSYAAPLAQAIESEPNNTFTEANPAAIPVNVSGSINPIADTDFYSLTTQAGLSYQALISISSAENLILRMRIYDAGQHLQGTSSSSYTSIEHTWTAYTPGTYLQIQEFDPTTSTTKTADYLLEIVQIAATHTPTAEPTNTPTPTPTSTPAPGPTSIPGADQFEPNYDFDHAATLGTEITYQANFIPIWSGSDDNDFYKIWIKPGLHFTCETLELAPGVDTNMIVFNGPSWDNAIGGNDDVELGDYRSRFSYFSTYEGWLYILVGHGGRLPASELEDSDYKVRCEKQLPGQPTATSTPEPASTPQSTAPPDSPTTTPTPSGSPVANPIPSEDLTVRTLTTPTPVPATTPAPRFIPISLLVYYDANDDHQAGAGEGIAGVSAQAYEAATNQLLAQGFTDEQGSLEFTVAAQGPVRVSVPFFGFSQLVAGEGASIYVRVPPQPLPEGAH